MNRIVVLGALMLMAGCATSTSGWWVGTELRMLDNGVVAWVPTGRCPYDNILADDPTDAYNGAMYTELSCKPVVVVDATDPKGVELWEFEMRVKQRGPYNTPVGRRPTNVAVAESEERCEQVRAKVAAQGTPTEPCHKTALRVAPIGTSSATR